MVQQGEQLGKAEGEAGHGERVSLGTGLHDDIKVSDTGVRMCQILVVEQDEQLGKAEGEAGNGEGAAWE